MLKSKNKLYTFRICINAYIDCYTLPGQCIHWGKIKV